MTLKFQKELFAKCNQAWRRIKNQLAYINLPSQEWEDIFAKASARVFIKYHLFDERKSKLYSWVFFAMRRSTWNSLRAVLPSKKYASHKWRTDFQHAIPIRTFLIQVNDYGEESVEVVPDIIDKREPNRWNLDGFKATLGPTDAQILQARIEGGTFKEIAKQFKLNGIAGTQSKIIKFAKLYKEYANS